MALILYEKQQIKLFPLKRFVINKMNLKITSKMESQFGLIHFFYSRYCSRTR